MLTARKKFKTNIYFLLSEYLHTKYSVKYMNAWFEIMNNCMPDIGSDKRKSTGCVVYFFLFFI